MKKINKVTIRIRVKIKILILLIVFSIVMCTVSCASHLTIVKVYDFDPTRCSQSKHVSLANANDTLDCFRFVKKIYNLDQKQVLNQKYYTKGIGYTFSVKKSFLVLDKKKFDTIAIVDYDGIGQVLITINDKTHKTLLTADGKEFYNALK